MDKVCIRQGLIFATLAALITGCSAWTGPRAAVEDRGLASLDRPKPAATKTNGGAKAAQPSRKAAKKPQREERQAAKEDISLNAKDIKEIFSTSAHAGADVMAGDQVLDMKPSRSPR